MGRPNFAAVPDTCIEAIVPRKNLANLNLREEKKKKKDTHFEFALHDDIFLLVDYRLEAPLAEQSARDYLQVVAPVVALARREKRQVEIAGVVVDGAAAAVAPCHRDIVPLAPRDVALEPGILMAADDDARRVLPEQQNVVAAAVVVTVEPVLQGQVPVDVVRLRDEDGLFDLVLGHVLRGTIRCVSQDNREFPGDR